MDDNEKEIKTIFEGINGKAKINIYEKPIYKNKIISKISLFRNQIIIRKNKRYILEIEKDNLNNLKEMKMRYKFNENSNEKYSLKTEIENIYKSRDAGKFEKFVRNMMKGNSEDKNIRLFGNKFVKINKNKCKIITNGHLEELKEFINNIDIKNQKLFKIKLISLDNVNDLTEMFYDCQYLNKIDYIDKLKKKN